MTKEIQLMADIALDPVTRVQAGALTCLYELGKLRYICVAQTEILRMIYPAVRDEYWGTLPFTISSEQVVIREDSFTIHYTALYSLGSPVYEAQYTIEGGCDGSIVFSMKGRALAAFKRNRIGLCVLHPVKECRGKNVVITRPDDTSYDGTFPEWIGPWQPFHEISQMQWTINENTTAELFFKGDVFETEDQRNWTDSSYKTYSTPLAIPFPVGVQAGEKLEQEIRLLVNDKGLGKALPEVKVREEKIPFPAIGYARSANQPALTKTQLAFLQKIPFHHYRVMLAMDKPDWQKELAVALAEAAQMNTRLELVLFFSDDYGHQLEALLPLLEENKALLFSLLPLHKEHAVTPAALLLHVYPRMKNALPALKIGCGTDQFFTELNRRRPLKLVFDFVSFSIHPQVHAADSRSLLENLESQSDIIATAGSFAAGKPVFLSPVTLKDRYYLPSPDHRQYAALAAWWTLAAIQQLAMAGSITLFELMGEVGLLKETHGPESNADSIILSPIYEVLASIQTFQPAWIIKRFAGGETVMDGLLLENEKGDRLFFKAPDAYRLFKSG